MQKPELKISVLSDYICPFCFIANRRLDALREVYTLKINWCFIEIHPETPPQGRRFDALHYSDKERSGIHRDLQKMAEDDGIILPPLETTANSRKALLLSQYSKKLGADLFYAFHNALFNAQFLEGENIGDEAFLRKLATQHNIPESIIQQAWSEDYADGPHNQTPPILLPYKQYAAALKNTHVPAIVIGQRLLSGVVSKDELLNAAKQADLTNA